jgi:rubrerythrin
MREKLVPLGGGDPHTAKASLLVVPLTRRALLSAAGGAAVLAGGCGDGGGGSGGASRPELRERDLRLLSSALDLEYTVLAAYAAGVELLSGSARAALAQVTRQERVHAARLAEIIRARGGRTNPPKTPEEYARSFPRLESGRDALRFAVDLENASVRLYLESLPFMSEPELRQAVAAIATSEAEHAALFRGELGRPQVPDAFVTGRSQKG